MIGKTLAHYEIIDMLGKGGMGEVYRGRDTKLGRDVAIKVLPTEMSGDPERLARFDREARTLATLQHANIASIYGFEKAGDVRILVMELVEGEELGERLVRGALPAERAVDMALQLADGLADAHAVGITHRDLKPANIKITPEGKLKILDFGLARTYAEDGGETNVSHSPTITAMTQAGVILGTAAYMSPEQARGKKVDHRADIWAYGAVVFEMLTAQRLFDGETVSDTLAGVLRAEVPWDDLPKNTPPTLRRLLERCLERDPARRLQSVAEARIKLEDLKAGREEKVEVRTESSGGSRERIVWLVAVVALVAALAATQLLPKKAPEPLLTQLTMSPPVGWDFGPGSPFGVSPDGRQIAFLALAGSDNEDAPIGSRSLWVRDLAYAEPRKIADVDGEGYPFWSPDGRWIGFYSSGKLNKVEARGGPVIPICDGVDGRGGTWNESGTIIFQRDWSEGLMKVKASGGTPEPVTTLNKDRTEVAHRWPQFLPDGNRFLFYVVSTTNTLTSEFSGIYVGSADSDSTSMLLRSESRALFASGHLVYRVGSTLMAHPFDSSSLEFTGDPIPVSTDITGGAISWGGAHFGVSDGGVLVHMRGSRSTNSVLQWRDRDGVVLNTVGDADGYWEPALSNDGNRLAVAVGTTAADIWIIDLERETRTRFTFESWDDRTPIWSPDDSRLAFTSARNIFVRPTSGQSDPELLFSAEYPINLTDWSSDGRYLFFTMLTLGDDSWDVWYFDMETSEAKPVVAGPFVQESARLSPDGKWLAFTSGESGKDEIYVQAFPDAQGRWMVSSNGGAQATWGGDVSEIYYMKDSAVWTVPVSGESNFSFGTPKSLFNVKVKTGRSGIFAVSRDGQKILTNELLPADVSKTGARLILNWTAALER